VFLDLEPEIKVEYDRALAACEPIERLPRPCVSVDDVLHAHFLIANHFYLEGEGIGGIGPKSPELLASSIYRQAVSLGGTLKWERLFDVTATLFFGIIKNHSFHDANKRTAFLTALYQLYENGFCPTVHENVFENLTVEVADNQLSKYSRYRDLLARKVDDPEVRFLSKWFQDNTRRVDNKKRSITFRELDVILKRYGFHLEEPGDNHIDVVRYEMRRRGLFGLGGTYEERIRINRIGFPGWSKQVHRSTLNHVRDMTGLSAKHGVDSSAFFDGLDTMQSLVTSYNEQLMRLAYR
jgi:death-on-curing family protein